MYPRNPSRDPSKDSSIRGRVSHGSVGSLAAGRWPSKPTTRVQLPPHALNRAEKIGGPAEWWRRPSPPIGGMDGLGWLATVVGHGGVEGGSVQGGEVLP